jgi:hypothetical protein
MCYLVRAVAHFKAGDKCVWYNGGSIISKGKLKNAGKNQLQCKSHLKSPDIINPLKPNECERRENGERV